MNLRYKTKILVDVKGKKKEKKGNRNDYVTVLLQTQKNSKGTNNKRKQK